MQSVSRNKVLEDVSVNEPGNRVLENVNDIVFGF
jgi:hypothetical protein